MLRSVGILDLLPGEPAVSEPDLIATRVIARLLDDMAQDPELLRTLRGSPESGS